MFKHLSVEKRNMGYWKTKVLPKIKNVFEKNGTKKAAAVQACKSFEESKEEINKEFEEKKSELQPKVLEIYEAASTEVKTLVKELKDAALKNNSAAVNKFLEELTKIEFPGSKQVCEASSKLGPQWISGPVLFIFEKVSNLVIVPTPQEEEKQVEQSETAGKEVNAEEERSGKLKDVVVQEEVSAEAEKTVPSDAATAAPEPEKKDEAQPPKAT